MKTSEANIEDLKGMVVSDGTMRPEDLIPKFLNVLKVYGRDVYDKYVGENPEVLDLSGMDDETMGWVVDELFDKLNEIAPEGYSFGSQDGDGACYGFWSVDADERKKCESYIQPVTLYSTTRYDDAEAVQSFLRDIGGDVVTVDKQRNGDVLSVNVSGSDDDVEAFVDTYKNEYGSIVKDCEVDATGWTAPEDIYYIATEQGRKELRGESKKQESEEPDAEMVAALHKKADDDKKWFGEIAKSFAKELDEVGLDGFVPVFRPKEPYSIEDHYAYNVEWQPYDKNGDYVKNAAFNSKTYGFVDCERLSDGRIVVNDYRPLDEESIEDFENVVVSGGTGDEGIFLWVLDKYKECTDKTESKKNETNSPEEAVKKVLMDASADAEFRREAGKDFSAEDFEKSIDANIEKLRDVFLEVLYFDDGSFKCDVNDHEETRDLCSFVASKVAYILGLPDSVSTAIDGYLLWYVVQENIVSDESKKSEADGDSALKKMQMCLKRYKDKSIGEIAADIRYDVATALDMPADEVDDVVQKFGLDNIYILRSKGMSPKVIAQKILATKNTESLDSPIDVKGRGVVELSEDDYLKLSRDINSRGYCKDKDGGYNVWIGGSFKGTFPSVGAAADAGYTLVEGKRCEAQVSEKTFKQGVDEFIGAAPEGGWSDYWAMQQDWEFYKDSLCRDGVITQKQADSWSNPCTPETFDRWQKRNGLVHRGYESKKSEARPTKQEAQIKELCKLCRNDKNVAESVFKALTKDYNTSLDPVLAGQYLTAKWKSKLEELGGCNGWYDGFKKLYAAMGSDFVCSVLQDLKLGSSGIGCGACITIVNNIYDKVVKRNDAKKSEAARDYIPKADNGRYDVHISVYGENGRLLHRDDYSAETSTTYRENVKQALDAYNSDRSRVLQRSPEKANEWVEPYRVVILTAPDGENTERVYDAKLHWLKGEDWRKFGKQSESKKSESLTLKQKELKDMVRYGEAEDITTISDVEAKELKKKGIETVGISRGVYGMNGALLRDSEGKKYVITARSSNLFYFV